MKVNEALYEEGYNVFSAVLNEYKTWVWDYFPLLEGKFNLYMDICEFLINIVFFL